MAAGSSDSRGRQFGILESIQEDSEDSPPLHVCRRGRVSPVKESTLAERRSERPLWPGGPERTAAAAATGESSPPPGGGADAASENGDRPEGAPLVPQDTFPTASKTKRGGPNRRLSMRSEEGEEPVTPRKKRRKIPPAVPEWLVHLMWDIEEATHHELVVE